MKYTLVGPGGRLVASFHVVDRYRNLGYKFLHLDDKKHFDEAKMKWKEESKTRPTAVVASEVETLDKIQDLVDQAEELVEEE